MEEYWPNSWPYDTIIGNKLCKPLTTKGKMSETYFELHENIVLQSNNQLCQDLYTLTNPKNEFLKAKKYDSTEQTHIPDQ